MFDAKKVKEEIVSWIRNYFEENSTPETKAVIGISGGKDSTVAAALCVEALGKNRILGVLMPQGKQEDIDVSYAVCKNLDIDFIEVNIESAVKAIYCELNEKFEQLSKITTMNTPARIRMSTLYAVSGTVGGRVVNTCNFSEDYVGYSTKFGDSAGDFSPLSDLTVTEVKAIGYELGLDPKFIDKTPIDGLCGKSDEENLGFSYAALDRYIRDGICEDADVKVKIDRLHFANLHKIAPMPKFVYPHRSMLNARDSGGGF